MPATPTQLFRGAAATTTTTLYTNTAPALRTLVTKIVVSNNAATAATFTLSLGGIALATAMQVQPNSVVVLDNIGQVLTGTQNIQGSATATTVAFHIAGLVVT